MNYFIIDGYTRSRMADTTRSVANVRRANEWAPRVRGPALMDRLGRTLVSVGVVMIRDRKTLETAAADMQRQAA